MNIYFYLLWAHIQNIPILGYDELCLKFEHDHLQQLPQRQLSCQLCAPACYVNKSNRTGLEWKSETTGKTKLILPAVLFTGSLQIEHYREHFSMQYVTAFFTDRLCISTAWARGKSAPSQYKHILFPIHWWLCCLQVHRDPKAF